MTQSQAKADCLEYCKKLNAIRDDLSNRTDAFIVWRPTTTQSGQYAVRDGMRSVFAANYTGGGFHDSGVMFV